MIIRRLTVLGAAAGLLALAACGEPTDDPAPAAAEPAAAAAFPAHGSPWYPTPAADRDDDPCIDRLHVDGKPQPC